MCPSAKSFDADGQRQTLAKPKCDDAGSLAIFGSKPSIDLEAYGRSDNVNVIHAEPVTVIRIRQFVRREGFCKTNVVVEVFYPKEAPAKRVFDASSVHGTRTIKVY